MEWVTGLDRRSVAGGLGAVGWGLCLLEQETKKKNNVSSSFSSLAISLQPPLVSGTWQGAGENVSLPYPQGNNTVSPGWSGEITLLLPKGKPKRSRNFQFNRTFDWFPGGSIPHLGTRSPNQKSSNLRGRKQQLWERVGKCNNQSLPCLHLILGFSHFNFRRNSTRYWVLSQNICRLL